MARATISTDLSLDTTRFQRGIATAQNRVKAFAASALRNLGLLAGAAGIGALSRAAINLGSKISDLSVQLMIGAEELQVLQFQAQEAGVKMNILERGLRNVNLRTQEAINGNKRYGDAFERLGISVSKFAQLTTEQKLEALAIAQAEATNKAVAYNDIAIILGERSGPALQEVLQKLAREGFDNLSKAAREAGQVMDSETVQKLDQAADRIEKAKTKLTILWGEVLTKVIPVFSILGGSLSAVWIILKGFGNIILAFGSTLGKVINIAVMPAITAFEALGLAASASAQAIKGNFSKAKELAMQAKDTIIQVADSIKAIPSESGKAFENLRLKANRIQDEAKKDGEAAANSIKSNFKDLFGLMDEAEEKASKLKEPGSEPGGGLPGDFEDSPFRQGATDSETKLRTPAKGIRFERVDLGNGEFTNQRFFNGRKAGKFTDEQLVNAAMGPKKKDENDEKAEERTKYLKNIDDLLKQLNGALKGG